METLTEILAWVGGSLLVLTPVAASLEKAALAFYDWTLSTETKKDDPWGKRAVRWTGRAANALEWLSERIPTIGTRGGRK